MRSGDMTLQMDHDAWFKAWKTVPPHYIVHTPLSGKKYQILELPYYK